MANHTFLHVEIPALDLEASGKFYHDLFGWTVRQIPEMSYATLHTGVDVPSGGLNPVSAESPVGRINVYIGTDDIQASARKVVELGGKLLTQPMPIPGVGLFAFFEDIAGNTLVFLEPHME